MGLGCNDPCSYPWRISNSPCTAFLEFLDAERGKMVGRFGYFFLLLITLVVIPGCTSRYDRVVATRPDGGISREIHHSFDIVLARGCSQYHYDLHTEQALATTAALDSRSLAWRWRTCRASIALVMISGLFRR